MFVNDYCIAKFYTIFCVFILRSASFIFVEDRANRTERGREIGEVRVRKRCSLVSQFKK